MTTQTIYAHRTLGNRPTQQKPTYDSTPIGLTRSSRWPGASLPRGGSPREGKIITTPSVSHKSENVSASDSQQLRSNSAASTLQLRRNFAASTLQVSPNMGVRLYPADRRLEMAFSALRPPLSSRFRHSCAKRRSNPHVHQPSLAMGPVPDEGALRPLSGR